ncbi:DEAD/DEAH box helicase [Clostridium sporogenes]|uniref:DEAD/DEAH box helicase n=1 Tax=Clostridium sporogenes TaxID=1509 RepID=UPI00313C9DDF
MNNINIIESINDILEKQSNSIVNIINDKFTLSVFKELEKNLKNIKEINFIIRNNFNDVNSVENNIKNIIFNDYDKKEKNNLEHFYYAKSMYEFINEKVNVKVINNGVLVKGNIFTINDEFMVSGSSSLEFRDMNNNEFYFNSILDYTMDKEQIIKANEAFKQLWYGDKFTREYKSELKETLNAVYKEYSPEFLYYFTLNELFGNQLDYGIERFEEDNIRFKETEIWKSLYSFQKDAVLSAIQKINNHNGCIIADSVGLGKTLEALAVIKYYELRQDNVLVLTPAKLYENWNSFRGGYKDSFLDESFNYKIMFHTDLSRYSGESRTGWDLSRFDWSKFDLVVIDESHNFRNRVEKEDRYTRYNRLMDEVVKNGHKTKMLLLSATPVNNSLTDLKNQISLITRDRDDAFKKEGINSIDNTLRRTTAQLNEWVKDPNKKKEELFNGLPNDFYKLLELLTIARSRSHITSYYGTEEIGAFPEKLKPKTLTSKIDKKDMLLDFESTNEKLQELNLAVYAPTGYILPEYIKYYRDKYEKRRNDGRVFMKLSTQESGIKVLHRFNLFKRLESSVFAFSETIRRLLERIDLYIEAIESNLGKVELIEEDTEDDFLEYKYEIKIDHLNKIDFLEDLYMDKEILESIYNESEIILKEERDKKLEKLREFIEYKVKVQPYNKGNKKVLIFTAFADTANYLYESLLKDLEDMGLNLGVITGSGKPKITNKNIKADFETVLCHFSPKSKIKKELPENEQIDILIATDCISEGQNLQDCDTVVNFDIQWNPVSLIQRFGRIDRLQSKNDKIKMVNFFPALELNEYLNLEGRVRNKMNLANLAGTGEDNALDPEMNDFNFRKKQLEKLQDEVIDIEEANEGISLTDFNMNEYLYELSKYISENPKIKTIPSGIYSVTDGEKNGVLYCFKHKNIDLKPNNDSSLYPYYLVFVDMEGKEYFINSSDRVNLREFRRLCKGKVEVNKNLYNKFYSETDKMKDLSKYRKLLKDGIDLIQGKEEEEAEISIFDFTGFDNTFKDEGIEDFELISFLVLK